MGSGFESQGAHFKENPADSSELAGFLRSPNKYSFEGWGVDISPCSGVRCLEDGIRPRSYRGGVGGYLASPKTTGCATCFLRAYAGAPVPRTLRSFLASLRRASVRHPEGASGKRSCTQGLPVGTPIRNLWWARGGFGGLCSDIRVPEAKRGRVPL